MNWIPLVLSLPAFVWTLGVSRMFREAHRSHHVTVHSAAPFQERRHYERLAQSQLPVGDAGEAGRAGQAANAILTITRPYRWLLVALTITTFLLVSALPAPQALFRLALGTVGLSFLVFVLTMRTEGRVRRTVEINGWSVPDDPN